MGGIGGIGLELQVGEPQVVTSAEESFLEKNAMGAQEPQTSYCKTPPTFVFEASTATEIGVSAQDGLGWAGMTAEPWQRKRQRSSQGTKSGLIWIL